MGRWSSAINSSRPAPSLSHRAVARTLLLDAGVDPSYLQIKGFDSTDSFDLGVSIPPPPNQPRQYYRPLSNRQDGARTDDFTFVF